MKYQVILELVKNDPPKPHEIDAAFIIAEYFRADVFFIQPGNFKTPDFLVGGTRWELKSPTGGSSRTIKHSMRTARKQSDNLIIDLSRTKLHLYRALAHIKFYMEKPAHFKKILVVTKAGKVIVVR
jgi:hypothetical protein